LIKRDVNCTQDIEHTFETGYADKRRLTCIDTCEHTHMHVCICTHSTHIYIAHTMVMIAVPSLHRATVKSIQAVPPQSVPSCMIEICGYLDCHKLNRKASIIIVIKLFMTGTNFSGREGSTCWSKTQGV